MNFMSRTLSIILTWCLFTAAGQDSLNTIDDKILIIEKEQTLKLISVNKRFNKMNYVPKHNSNNNLEYVFSLPDYKSDALELNPKVYHFDSLYNFESKKAYLKLGLGNFGTGYLRGVFNSRTAKLNYGADILLQHSLRGPVDRQNSASNTSHFKLLGNYLRDADKILTFKVGYNFRRRHFYGYKEKPANPQAIRQDFQFVESQIQYKSRSSSNNLKTGFNFYNWQNRNSQTERFAKIDLAYTPKLNPTNKFNLLFKGVYNTLDSLQRHLITLGGGYVGEIPKLYFELGMRLTYLSDTSLNQKQFNIYPKIQLRYFPNPYLNLAAEISGQVQENYLNHLTVQNPFLNQINQIVHSNNTLHAALILNFQTKRSVGVSFTGSYDLIDNLLLMLNNQDDLAKFDLYYDNASLLGLKAEAYFKTESFGSNIALERIFYNLKQERWAWHRPTLKATLNAEYRYQKWSLNMDLYILQGIRSFDFDKFQTITNKQGDQVLSAIYDLNLSLNYRMNTKFYIFAKVNNLFNKSYQEYYRYISKPFNLLMGLTLTF